MYNNYYVMFRKIPALAVGINGLRYLIVCLDLFVHILGKCGGQHLIQSTMAVIFHTN